MRYMSGSWYTSLRNLLTIIFIPGGPQIHTLETPPF